MNEKKLKVGQRRVFSASRKLSCLVMEGNEGQRIKEVSTPQVIVWGRRQQKFGRDMVML